MRICRSIGRFSTDTFYRSGLSFHFQIFVGDRQTNSLYLGRTRSGTRGLSSSPRRPPSLPPDAKTERQMGEGRQGERERAEREGASEVFAACAKLMIPPPPPPPSSSFLVFAKSPPGRKERERERERDVRRIRPSFLPSSFLPPSSLFLRSLARSSLLKVTSPQNVKQRVEQNLMPQTSLKKETWMAFQTGTGMAAAHFLSFCHVAVKCYTITRARTSLT